MICLVLSRGLAYSARTESRCIGKCFRYTLRVVLGMPPSAALPSTIYKNVEISLVKPWERLLSIYVWPFARSFCERAGLRTKYKNVEPSLVKPWERVLYFCVWY